MALPALLGGAGISLAAHELLLLTGDIFGVSGFVHRSLQGKNEALAGVAGLVVSGVVVSRLEGANSTLLPLNASSAWFLFSGFLVGLGTKVTRCVIFKSISSPSNKYKSACQWLYFWVCVPERLNILRSSRT